MHAYARRRKIETRDYVLQESNINSKPNFFSCMIYVVESSFCMHSNVITFVIAHPYFKNRGIEQNSLNQNIIIQ